MIVTDHALQKSALPFKAIKNSGSRNKRKDAHGANTTKRTEKVTKLSCDDTKTRTKEPSRIGY